MIIGNPVEKFRRLDDIDASAELAQLATSLAQRVAHPRPIAHGAANVFQCGSQLLLDVPELAGIEDAGDLEVGP